MSARRGKKHFGAMQHRRMRHKLRTGYDSRRRTDLKKRCALLLVIASLGLTPSAARSQAYPSKPITLVVPFAPGAVTDLMARVAAELIRTQSGQAVIVENRPGASGNIGTRGVARAAPDGYTLGFVTSNLLISNPSFFADMGFDPIRELVSVGSIGEFPQLLVTSSRVPTRTLREFIDLAKAKPDQLSYGSAGRGSASHLAVHTFASLAGIKLIHVPYRGMAPALVDLLAGRLQLIGAGLAVVKDHLETGNLRALAVGSRNRIPQLPDVPTGEQAGVAGYESIGWSGIVVPKDTPKEIVDRLNGYLAVLSSDPAARKQLQDAYVNPLVTTPQELATMIEKEKSRWDNVRSSGLDLN
jgi:tripartite-type tricarboxylate transporter receptor subunit TctC